MNRESPSARRVCRLLVPVLFCVVAAGVAVAADREIPLDWSEMAQFMENDEVLEALEERTRARMEALAAALRRLEEGTYGTCGSCGKTISEERLDVLPTTAVCAS